MIGSNPRGYYIHTTFAATMDDPNWESSKAYEANTDLRIADCNEATGADNGRRVGESFGKRNIKLLNVDCGRFDISGGCDGAKLSGN
jgi:hypothetical protein